MSESLYLKDLRGLVAVHGDQHSQRFHLGAVIDATDHDDTVGSRTADQLLDALFEDSMQRWRDAEGNGADLGIPRRLQTHLSKYTPGFTSLRDTFNAEVRATIRDAKLRGEPVEEGTVVTHMIATWMAAGIMPPYTEKLLDKVGANLLYHPGWLQRARDCHVFMRLAHPLVEYQVPLFRFGRRNPLCRRQRNRYRVVDVPP